MTFNTNLSNSSINNQNAAGKTVVVAGATGNLGFRIASYLLIAGAKVVVPVRDESSSDKIALLRGKNAIVKEVDFSNRAQLADVCTGADCVVSALSGLYDVIVDVQTNLVHAAIEAGVPRFIPSDYAIDYTKLAEGSNRNLDLRRTFNNQLDTMPIRATSILNGMFTDLLQGEAPLILKGIQRVIYWGDANQLMDFTTIDNTAEYTALAALDADTPRYLKIAGEVANAKDLRDAASKATGKTFKLLRAGGLGTLKTMIKITKTLVPKKDEVFPPWQGMQYLHNMATGLPKFDTLDNNRYPGIDWTPVVKVLEASVK